MIIKFYKIGHWKCIRVFKYIIYTALGALCDRNTALMVLADGNLIFKANPKLIKLF